MVACLAALYFLEQSLCVSQTACDSDLDFHARYIVGSFLDTLNATHIGKFNGGALGLACQLPYRCAESSLHYAARRAEDDRRARACTERTVAYLVGQVVEHDTRLLDKASQLTCCDGRVKIGNARRGLIVPANLVLLGCAGHDAHAENILGILAKLLRVVGLDNRAEHLLRRLAGGQIRDKLGEVVLAVANPPGRAACDHRQHAAVLHSVDKFSGFFHNGEVCREIGVEYLVEAESAHCGYHLALDVGSDGIAERLTQRSADSGSCLNNNHLLGVCDSLQYLGGIVLLFQSARRTGGNALTAGNAGGFRQRHIKRRSYLYRKTALICADYADTLKLFAGCHAAAAENALAVVARHVRRAVVYFDGGIFTLVVILHNIILVAKLLNLAASASYAGETFSLVVGKNKLQCGAAALNDLGSIRKYLHTLVDGIYAGSHQASRTLDLDHADTACADLVYILKKTQRRNLNARKPCRFENSRAFGSGAGNAVYFNVYHFFSPFL